MAKIYDTHTELNEYSWARYSCIINSDDTFEWIGQNLLDSEDHDWRTEFNSIIGKIKREENQDDKNFKFAFVVEGATGESCSYAYASGPKQYQPSDFKGEIKEDGKVLVADFGNEPIILNLSSSTKTLATKAMVYPDYIFG
jgi:hypothetical protein